MSKKHSGSAAKTRGLLALGFVCACAALALGLTGYAAQAPEPSLAELLPVWENPLATRGTGGTDKFYVIQADGTLIESFSGYGERDTGSGFTFNQTREVMGNTAAVYSSEESAVLAVDRDGTLWLVDRGVENWWLKALQPDFTSTYDDHPEPVRLLEDVAMAAPLRHHAVILKRDGALWVAGYDSYGAPWLGKEGNDDPYFFQVMDNVVWADASYFGGYAVTAGHELWAWGLSADSTGPEKLLDGVSRVCSNNTAIMEDGELVNWYYTQNEDGSRIWYEPYTVELDGKAVQSGRGYYILEDGSIWANTAGWMNRMNSLEKHMWIKYSTHGRSPYDYKWCELTPGSAAFQDLGVEDAAYAVIGQNKTVALDKNGVLWGIYDLNLDWEGDFGPFQPIRLMDGCYGAEEPATYGMDNFKKVQEYQPGTFADVKESDWFYDNVKAAYELGLMVGGGGKFRPNDTITLAEAAAIAARVRAAYWGEELKFPTMLTWWQPYVYYAQATELHKIGGEMDGDGNLIGLNYTRPATRDELASLLCRTLPLTELPTLNKGTVLPDIDQGSYENDMFWMAQAGIVAGKDDGRFDPTAPVKRCEAAAMLTRCVYPALRVRFEAPAKVIVEFDDYYTPEEIAAWAEKYGITVQRVFIWWPGSDYNKLEIDVENNNIAAGIDNYKQQVKESGQMEDEQFPGEFQQVVDNGFKIFALTSIVSDGKLEMLNSEIDCVRVIRIARPDDPELVFKPDWMPYKED